MALNIQLRFPSANQSDELPQPEIWNRLLSGNRERIALALQEIDAAGLSHDYGVLLLSARRRNARRVRQVGPVQVITRYRERERRSALLALGMLWGAFGKDIAKALDPKATHFEREHAHQALIRRRDPRAVPILLDAMLSGHALEDWQCITTLGALGDLRAADALLSYVGLETGIEREPNIAFEYGIEVGRALRLLKAQPTIARVKEALQADLARQRAAATVVLAGWGDESLVNLITPLLEDSEASVRRAAVMALGELNVAATLIPIHIINDDDPDVRAAAAQSLQRVSTSGEKTQSSNKPQVDKADRMRR
jgi:hypothetical protein